MISIPTRARMIPNSHKIVYLNSIQLMKILLLRKKNFLRNRDFSMRYSNRLLRKKRKLLIKVAIIIYTEDITNDIIEKLNKLSSTSLSKTGEELVNLKIQ